MIIAYVEFYYDEQEFEVLFDEEKLTSLKEEDPELLKRVYTNICIFRDTIRPYCNTFMRDFEMTIDIDIEMGCFSLAVANYGCEDALEDFSAENLINMMHMLSSDEPLIDIYFWDFDRFMELMRNESSE